MPHAIVAAIKVAAVWLAKHAVVKAIVKAIVVNAIMSGISKALTPKQKDQQVAAIVGVEYQGTVEARRLIYGTMRVSGMDCIPANWISGSSGEYLHQVLALAGREVSGITDVYFDDTTIASANIAGVSYTTSDGLVSSGTYTNLAWIRRYTGTATQNVDTILNTAFPSNWASTATGRGIAYLAMQFKLDQTAYKNGKPQVACLVQGHKVYDPRQDSTNGGSGSQRYATPSTWTYSSNPALILRDYLTSSLGLGDAHTKIDDAMVITAANICDETPSIPGGGTQTRYTCNCVLLATARYEDNIQTILSSMLGTCFWSGGKWRMFAGAWNASSSFTLTEADLVGPYTVQTEADPKDKFNAVRGTFWDSARMYQETEFQPRLSASYEATDGERLYLDTQFPATTNEYEAERNAMLLLRLSRRTKTISGVFAMTAFNIRPFERGTITLSDIGWTNQNVRCLEWEFDPAGAVKMTLRAEESTDWSDPLTTDYGTPTTATDPAASSWAPQTPTGFTVVSGDSAIRFEWSEPSIHLPSDKYELWEYTASTPFASASLIWSGKATSVTFSKTDTTTRYYWLRTKNTNGNVSATTPASVGTAGVSGTVDTGMITPGAATDVVAATYTGPSTVLPLGGSPGYSEFVSISGSAFDGTLDITATLDQANTVAANGVTAWIHWDGGDGYNTPQYFTDTAVRRMTLTKQVTRVVADGGWSVSIRAGTSGGSADGAISSISIIAAAIKR